MDKDDPGIGYAILQTRKGFQPRPTNPLGWKREFRFFGREVALWENPTAAVWDAAAAAHDAEEGGVEQPAANRQQAGGKQDYATGSYRSGLVAWNSAVIICAAIECELVPKWPATRLSGASVLDIGAGTGVFGLAAAAAGARVVMADYEPTVLDQLQANAYANAAVLEGSVRCQRLDWCSPADSDATSLADSWPFDLIVAADLLYNDTEYSWPDLAQTLAKIATPETDVLVGYELRHNVDAGNFFRLAERWFDVEAIALPSHIFEAIEARGYEGAMGGGNVHRVKAAILRLKALPTRHAL
jgi:predicted nicotinamide N-methyase